MRSQCIAHNVGKVSWRPVEDQDHIFREVVEDTLQFCCQQSEIGDEIVRIIGSLLNCDEIDSAVRHCDSGCVRELSLCSYEPTRLISFKPHIGLDIFLIGRVLVNED